MSDENPIVVPPSFIALYIEPGRLKPSAPRQEIAARHEFCEDLAQMLTEQAMHKRWQLSITEDGVLQRMLGGLCGTDSVVKAPGTLLSIQRLVTAVAVGAGPLQGGRLAPPDQQLAPR